jgi:pyridoxal phosphate enzyme (YggS family)
MEPSSTESIARRVQEVRSRIRAAAARAGRPADRVRLVGVTKTVTVDRIQEALAAGLTILGENRVQEALPKIAALKPAPIRWHFIGHLQRRKVRLVLGVFELIHSVDSVELGEEINRRAGDAGLRQDILLEVNIGREATKSGFHPGAVEEAVSSLASLPHVQVKGLMAIPPPTPRAELARGYFRSLRELAARIAALKLPSVSLDELSMGMSNDYEVAVEEGATLVRVGTAIFGARDA